MTLQGHAPAHHFVQSWWAYLDRRRHISPGAYSQSLWSFCCATAGRGHLQCFLSLQRPASSALCSPIPENLIPKSTQYHDRYETFHMSFTSSYGALLFVVCNQVDSAFPFKSASACAVCIGKTSRDCGCNCPATMLALIPWRNLCNGMPWGCHAFKQ